MELSTLGTSTSIRRHRRNSRRVRFKYYILESSIAKKILAFLRSRNIALSPSVLHKWIDEDAADSRRLQDGDLYHEWFVALSSTGMKI